MQRCVEIACDESLTSSNSLGNDLASSVNGAGLDVWPTSDEVAVVVADKTEHDICFEMPVISRSAMGTRQDALFLNLHVIECQCWTMLASILHTRRWHFFNFVVVISGYEQRLHQQDEERCALTNLDSSHQSPRMIPFSLSFFAFPANLQFVLIPAPHYLKFKCAHSFEEG